MTTDRTKPPRQSAAEAHRELDRALTDLRANVMLGLHLGVTSRAKLRHIAQHIVWLRQALVEHDRISYAIQAEPDSADLGKLMAKHLLIHLHIEVLASMIPEWVTANGRDHRYVYSPRDRMIARHLDGES